MPQQAGDKRFACIVQLLATERGEQLVRFPTRPAGRLAAARSRCARVIWSGSALASPTAPSSPARFPSARSGRGRFADFEVELGGDEERDRRDVQVEQDAIATVKPPKSDFQFAR